MPKSNKPQDNSMFKEPSLDTLRRLFAATKAFHALAPWKWMTKNDIVAVHDPLSDRIAYCFTLTDDKGKIGFDAFLDDIGLSNCQEIIAHNRQTGANEFSLRMNSIGLILVVKEDLPADDLALCKKAGMTHGFGELWPIFRRFEPGYAPWWMQEADAHFLMVCLEQMVDVAGRAVTDHAIIGPRNGKTFLVRIPDKTKGGIVWREEFISPEPLKRVILIKPKVDLEKLKEIFRSAKQVDTIWEADCFFAKTPIAEPGGRPRFPFYYFVAENESGFLFHISILKENDHGAGFLDKLCEVVQEHRIYPRTIRILQSHLESVFAPLSGFGITIEVVNKLHAIENARKVMKGLKTLAGINDFKKAGPETTKKEKSEESPVYKRRKIFKFKVSLGRLRPEIWREFQVESSITLKRFAEIVLIVMGWENKHLHKIDINGRQFGLPSKDSNYQFEDESKVSLDDFKIQELSVFVLTYDFKDGWEHLITLEDILEPKEGAKYPVCTYGERQCPPENCGGYTNFVEFVDAVEYKYGYAQYKDIIDKIGGKFNAKKFDLKGINKKLNGL